MSMWVPVPLEAIVVGSEVQLTQYEIYSGVIPVATSAGMIAVCHHISFIFAFEKVPFSPGHPQLSRRLNGSRELTSELFFDIFSLNLCCFLVSVKT